MTATTDSSSVSFDPVAPSATLSSSAPSTLTGAFSVTAVLSETASGFSVSDISVSNGTASGFSQDTATGYSFTVTPTVSTGTLTVQIGTGTFADPAGNANSSASNVLSYSVAIPDTTAPVVAVSSHSDTQQITGSTVSLTGSVSDTGGVASVSVNGLSASLTGGTWSLTLTGLTAGNNAVTAVATDLSGNTGSVSIGLVRIPDAPTGISVSLSGSTEAVVSFATDLSSTGTVLYGTNSGSLGSSQAGSSAGTSHQITLSGLSADTTYYYRTYGMAAGYTGSASSVSSFKTPAIVDLSSTGTVTATGSAYLSGATSTGATFASTGTLLVASDSSSGSSVSIAMSGTTISASGSWDGVFQAPTPTSNSGTGTTATGYSFTGTVYQIGSPNAELTLTGGTGATVTIQVGTAFSGQTLKVYRSTDGGTSYSYLADCSVGASGACSFGSTQFSLFALASPSDSTPNAFSFTDVTGAELSTAYESNAITVSGINVAATISVSGGLYSIDGGSYTGATGTVSSGSTVKAKATSSASNSTASNVVLTIGGVSDTYTVTTKAASSSSSSSSGGGGGGGSGFVGTKSPSSATSSGVSVQRTSGNEPPSDDTVATDNGAEPILTLTGDRGTVSVPEASISVSKLTFRDISGHWAKSYVEKLAVRGIVNNAQEFRPENPLTRAEFLKILGNSAGWDLASASSEKIAFSDVPQSAWYAQYVRYATANGIVMKSERFRPNDPITRAEVAKIMVSSLVLSPKFPATSSFADVSSGHSLAKYVEASKSYGFFEGQLSNGKRFFRPDAPITRAEIAKVVSKALGF